MVVVVDGLRVCMHACPFVGTKGGGSFASLVEKEGTRRRYGGSLGFFLGGEVEGDLSAR